MYKRQEADLSLSDLLHRKIDPSNIVITGAKADLVRDGQGKLVGKVKDAAAGEPAKAPPTPEQILAALAGKTIRLVDSHFNLQDQQSNFAFDAVLPTLDLQGDSGDGVTAPVSYTHLDVYKRQEVEDTPVTPETRATAPSTMLVTPASTVSAEAPG